LVAVLGPVASVGELAVVALAVVALLVLIGLYFLAPREDGRALRRFEVAQLRRARWGATILGVALWLLALGVIRDWLSALPPNQRERVVANWAVFPVSLAYCVHYYWPLVLNGLFVVLRKQEGQYREYRLVLACIGWILAILVATSVVGGANLTPFRTVLALSAALLPFAIAPLFDRAPESVSNEDFVGALPRSASLTIGVALLVLGANGVANHSRIDFELPEPHILKRKGLPKPADVYALGAWMRAQVKAPGELSVENLSHPFELALTSDLAGIRQALIEYHVGDPARFAHPHRLKEPVRQTQLQLLAKLAPGQVLISDYEIEVPELRLVTRLGQYRVYERTGP
jgi:hypothetical protein